MRTPVLSIMAVGHPDLIRGLWLIPERVRAVGQWMDMPTIDRRVENVNACCALSGRYWGPESQVVEPAA